MKKALLWGGIIVVAVVVLLVVAVVIGSGGSIFNNGVPLGNVGFAQDSIPGMPAYPGATQSTDSTGITVPDDMRRVIPQNQDKWNRYVVADATDKVSSWYDKAMADAGFEAAKPRDSGVKVFFKSGARYAVYVTVVEGKTNVVTATGIE